MRDFISNREGTCVTAEGLDRLLPRDDRPVDLTDPAYDILFTNKGAIIRDCRPGEQTYEEQVGREELITFVFDGGEVHTTVPQVPTPEASILMATAMMAFVVSRLPYKPQEDVSDE